MEITKDIRYIGVNDHDIDLFEGQYDVSENGMAYNSYVILGDKIAVADSVDADFVDEWLGNLEAVLDGRTPDYLVVHHMEPDHSAGIAAFMERYPQAQIVASMGAFRMMVNYFGTDYPERKMVVKEGDVLDLGGHSLTFVGAPNVHWPEVIFSYESTDKVLFSADGFGKFGANDIEDPEGWACEARRYYFGIVGKFGKFVQTVLKNGRRSGYPDHLSAPWSCSYRESGLLPRHLQHLVELSARGRGHHDCLCERVRPSEGRR